MSYDLNFWRYKKGACLDNQEVYEKCSDGYLVAGLDNLPVDVILKDIQTEFLDWRMENGHLEYENPDENGAFQIFYTPQFIRFDCYGMIGDNMNRIIEIMSFYNCPLYDPQVEKRYDGN